jgi:hypothetical protein
MLFDAWTGTRTDRLSDANSPNTSYRMPGNSATLRATYKTADYALTVNSGSGDGQYVAGSVVAIAADAPPSGQIFDAWTGNGTANLSDSTAPNTTLTMPAADATLTATYADSPTVDPPDPVPDGLQNEFSIVAVGTVRGRSRTVIIESVRNKTWAQYALWSDNNRDIYFKSGEVFDGAVHANTALYFSGNPIFHGAVTSGTDWYGGSISHCTFDQGFTYPVEVETMASVDFADLETKAALVLSGITTIELTEDSMRISNSRAGWSNFTTNIPYNGLIYIANATTGSSSTRSGDLYVEGELDGRLTFATERDINITDNLTYLVDPKTDSTSDDALGLIANRDIVVKPSCPDNVEIYAHMLATGNATSSVEDGSFGVEDYNEGDPRGDLTVHGGIAQDCRGAVGTFNTESGVTSHGFEKNYTYDTRFASNPPPNYPPLSNQLTSGLWRDR